MRCRRIRIFVRGLNIAGIAVLGVGRAVLPARIAAQQPAATASALVFDGVTVVDVEEGKLVSNRRVVIVGARIDAVGSPKAVKLPAGAQVVDARGKYLIPGLWDIHIHPAWSTDLFYPLLLANGVTGFRDAGSPVPIPQLRLWQREILAGTRVGPPRQVLSGQSLDQTSEDGTVGPGVGCIRGAKESITTCVTDTADAVHVVDSLQDAGADMIKMHWLSPWIYFPIAAEARRRGIPFGGHVADNVGQSPTAEEASDSGARVVDHLRFTNPFLVDGVPFSGGLTTLTKQCLEPLPAKPDECRAKAETFRRHDTWVSIDGIIWQLQTYGGHEEFWAGRALPVQWLRDSILARRDSAGPMRLMDRVNFPILAGTDLSGGEVTEHGQIPGFLLQATLAAYVAGGMSPMRALQAATVNPARMLHATDSLGTVATGKLADLVLLDANPLVDIANLTTIRAVVANGRYFDRAALDELLMLGRRAR